MNLVEAYASVYYTEENILEDLYNLFSEYELFDTVEETLEFAEELVNQEMYGEFLGELANIMEVDISEYLVEGVIVERAAALRGIINALSAAGRTKAGLKAGTALGKKPETIVKGAAASTSIRSARTARTPAPVQPQAGRGLAAQQLRRSADVSKATKALPSAGQSSSGSIRATTQRGMTRHNQAVSSGQQAIDQAKVVAAAFMKAMRQGQAQAKLTKAASGTKGTGVRIAGGSKATVGPTKTDADTWKKLNKTASKSLDYQLAQKPAPVPAWNKPSAPKMPSTLRKDIRATGPGGDARTQRLASQAAPGSGVRPKASAMTSSADALNAARKALAVTAGAGALGVAAQSGKEPAKKSNPESSVNKYNTMDSDGKVRNRLKVGSKIVGTGNVAGDFDVAFKKAKTSGEKEFEFKGKKYNTKLKNEEVDYFDIVMDHLISEGYVDTNEDALVMMAALDESAIARIAALFEQKYRIIKKDGTETISDTPLYTGSGAASTVKPIPTTVKRKYENPYRPRPGESD